MDEEGNQFVAYFLPNEETIRKRKRDSEEGVDYMAEDLWVKMLWTEKRMIYIYFYTSTKEQHKSRCKIK